MSDKLIRILLSHPKAQQAEAMAAALQRGIPGCVVEKAAGHAELIAQVVAGKSAPHLVVAEFENQGIVAPELLNEIAEHGIPVPVLVTAVNGNEETAVTALRAGAAGYLPCKPGYLDALPREALRAILDYRKQRSERERSTELENTTRVLQQRDEKRSEFISVVSHELRTPMTVIRAAIDNAVDGVYGDLNHDQANAMGKLVGHIDRLVRMVNDLLEMTRIEGRVARLDYASFDVQEWLDETIEPFRMKAAEQGISLELATDPGLQACADRDRLTQVVTNLLSNAYKFTPQGGTVTVEAKRDGSDALRVSVHDTGCGIPEGEHEKVFEKFHKASNQPKGVKGAGLGLAISREIVRMHGGEIGVKPREGGGTTFAFIVPLVPKVQPRRPATIVVVDDHHDSLDMLSRYITRAAQGRCRVLTASDPRQALDFIEDGKVDLVFSDICMPDIDGIRLAQVAKARNPRLKVVLMTAYQEYYSEEDTRKLGADAYLAKPLDFGTIRDIVEKLTSGDDARN